MHVYIDGSRQPLGAGFDDYLNPTRTAVVSIDLHRGHLEDDPDCPCPAPRARAIVEGVNRFHAAARAAGVPVIHVRSTLRKGGVDDIAGIPSAWRRVFPLHVGPIPNSDGHAIEGSRWTEFVTAVDDRDLVVSGKKRLSAFYPTDLDFLLRNMGVEALILNGCLADCCVLNTAFDGSNMGYRVTVLRDLVAGTTEDLEAASLKIVAMHLGLVADADDLLGAWREMQPATKKRAG
ncbi:cysteine hydrolase [Tistrella mobilis]|uniref:isochorismatase family cysteine hydrolase n=1 Tax=Tistrella mobilis TaxID=171437 RepID=UPI0035570C95